MALERVKGLLFHRHCNDRSIQYPLPEGLSDGLIRSLQFFQKSPDYDNRFAQPHVELWSYHAQQLFCGYFTIKREDRSRTMDWLTHELDGSYLSRVVEMIFYSFKNDKQDSAVSRNDNQYYEVADFMQDIFIWANTQVDSSQRAMSCGYISGATLTKAEVVYESLKKSWEIPSGFFDDIFFYRDEQPIRGLEQVSSRYLQDKRSNHTGTK